MSKTVLITGASKGIGRACAEKFYASGCNVCVVYHSDDEAMESFCNGKDSGRILIAKADVADFYAVQTLVSDAIKKFNTIDVLINNAGISQWKMMNDITEDDWDRMFDVNVKGMFNCVKACMDTMINKKSGSIINISSIWGVCGASCEVHYSASKAAVIGFTKALAKEFGPSGIRVNCIAPGVIDTAMNSNLDKQTLDELKNETPLLKIGSPDEIASVAEFFASDASSFVTGQVLTADGGFIL